MKMRVGLLLASIGILVSVGWATAAVPSLTSGAIDACYVPGVGTLRVINYEAGKRCRSDERRLTWNQPQSTSRPVLYWTAVATGEATDVESLRQHAYCPAGYRVIGGGFTLAGEVGTTLVMNSRRSTDGGTDSWEVDVVRTDGQRGYISFDVQAHCLYGMTQGED